jgi:hypothetical protein
MAARQLILGSWQLDSSPHLKRDVKKEERKLRRHSSGVNEVGAHNYECILGAPDCWAFSSDRA